MGFLNAIAPAIGGIISGGLGFLGQGSANQANKDIAAGTNAMNMAIAQKQMAFQEKMSSSAWQRGIEDMKKAGVNPMLAVSQGAASSPSGAAVGAVTGAPMKNKAEGATQAFNSAMDAMTRVAQLDQIRAQTDKVVSDIDFNSIQKAKALTETAILETNAKAAALRLPGLQTESDIDKTLFGKALRYVDRANPVVSTAKGVAKAFQKPVYNKHIYYIK